MAHVTDYDVWHEEEEPVSVEALIATLNTNTVLAQQVVARVVESLASVSCECECREALASAIITQRDLIPSETIDRLRPIVSKYL
jgi:5'-methylthioadenosine phosphorylase